VRRHIASVTASVAAGDHRDAAGDHRDAGGGGSLAGSR